jgi:RNA polymerase sigma-70 factor, ECF subfamily
MSKIPAVSSEELLLAIANGNRAAFRTLYAETGPRLYAICLRMLKARDQAEDVMQAAFVRIWERSHQFDPAKGEAMAWLATVTRHCALDRLRAQPKATISFDESVVNEIDGHMAAFETSPAGNGDLHRCLKRLREDYRNVVVLAYVNGLTHEELAERFGKPLGTVKSWVKRGLEQLKGCMDA